MSYYYSLGENNYIKNWSVGASFIGATELPTTVTVPDDLKTCNCNAQCYKLENGVFTFDVEKATTCEAECEASDALYCYATIQYVDDLVGNVETVLQTINSGSGV